VVICSSWKTFALGFGTEMGNGGVRDILNEIVGEMLKK
jgi:hypothetical protein